MEMRLCAPVTRGYFFLLGALRLVNVALPRNIDQKKISSGTQGRMMRDSMGKILTRMQKNCGQQLLTIYLFISVLIGSTVDI